MSENIFFRPAIKSDIPQLMQLMNAQYSRKKKAQYFLWQYFNSYYPTVLLCAFVNDILIGMFGLQKRRMNIGANAAQAIDLLISPEWRGKGVFVQLWIKVSHFFEDIDLFFVLPNLNGKNTCEKSLGWKTIGKINSMCILPDYIKNISKENIDQLQMVKQKNSLVSFIYNDDIINWRFNQHPDFRYDKISINSYNFAITKIFTDPTNGQSFGDIVYFKCAFTNKSACKELLLKLVLHLQKYSVINITTWALPHTAFYMLLKSLGFTEQLQERYFCIKVLKTSYNYLVNLTKWDIFQADAEIY